MLKWEVLTENRIATMALLLKNNPDVHLNVIGHTDNIGTPKFNKQLGLKRAKAVVDYLVINYNVTPVRLKTNTKGEVEPLSSVTEKLILRLLINQSISPINPI